MSIKGKDLSYEAQEPAFLRRIRAQQAGFDPDRHERPIARPRRAKADTAEDDDAPTYVDEESNQNLSTEEYEALLNPKNGQVVHEGREEDISSGGQPGTLASAETEEPQLGAQAPRSKQDITEAGKAHKKRKAAKAVGAAEDEDRDIGDERNQKIAKQRPKKKPKAALLSFGADDG